MRFSSCACSSSVAASSAFSIRLSTSKRPRKRPPRDRKSTRLNSSHGYISYAVFCLKKKKKFLLNVVAFIHADCPSASTIDIIQVVNHTTPFKITDDDTVGGSWVPGLNITV